jgi:hypothetical protein
MEIALFPTTIDEFYPLSSSAAPRFVSLIRAFAFIAVVAGTAVLTGTGSLPVGTKVNDGGVVLSATMRETIPPSDRFASLRIRWGDPDEKVVDEDTIANLALLLDGLPGGLAQPHLSSSSEGEVGLSWMNGSDRLEAMLDPPDQLAWITKRAGTFAVGGDVNVLSEVGRDAFYEALGGFYGRV